MLKMFHRFPAWLGAAAFVFLTVLARAAPVFLSPSDYDPKALLPPPPPERIRPPPRPSWRNWTASRASARRRHFARADQDFRTRNGIDFRRRHRARL